MTNYDVDYFIKKFEAIPEDKWTIGQFTDNDGRYCAMGHCGVREGLIKANDEASSLIALIFPHFANFACINDGIDWEYLNLGEMPNTPKARILKILNYIKNNPEEAAHVGY